MPEGAARRLHMKCPKCGEYNAEPVHTEEQTKKFDELRAQHAKKK